jgi:hypothetical protein
MTNKVDVSEVKYLFVELNRNVNLLIKDRESLALMVLAEKALKDFIMKEPDVYSVKDVRAGHLNDLKNTLG